ncbi:MAG TPA: fibrobacter succinogenes major paralogous domain-containing protein [Bacteroidales bacterium]|jgi:uncharacterized protein (TIGR02145 family)|nr:fibrobacter succinogenes major paralogous domain-containing protein [Bacteroidales bacterium]HOX73102.1 fibrobacter succinogenes major paralogous domain-containing protein [Bacteroidales bacterium]HPM86414.1 fibrobacter succinogenes major paralogous domain-containing protein [Bacteroidales bacterium]HQM69015.1 fibrobacter succinogenes major paralogous domain-containing protein [Bacteroidales bacterium]
MRLIYKIKTDFTILLLTLAIIITSCKKDNDPEGPEPGTPEATTNQVALFGQKWARLAGSVNANNNRTLVYFEYGPSNSYGFTISADPDTLTDNTSTSVSAVVSGLIPGKTYNYRVKAVTASETVYGNDLTFKTSDTIKNVIVFNPGLTYGNVTDIDGNKYKTIQIGVQTWMAENLNAVTFSDGTAIPFVRESTAWAGLSTPGYCWYNYDSISYGGLYNWYVVSSTANGGKNVCPAGWHIPSDAEWETMVTYLGGGESAGGKLKETGTTHWVSTSPATTNETGFTAIPAGYRYFAGSFNSIKRYGYWWSSTGSSTSDAYCRNMNYGYNSVEKTSSSKKSGLSVRCIKD